MNIYGERVLLRATEREDNALPLRLINDPDTEQMLDGVLRSRVFKNGVYVDMKSYSRLKYDPK